MNTITKEQCRDTINEFFSTHSLNAAQKIIDYYLELMEDKDLATNIKNYINANYSVINLYISKAIVDLETRFSLIEITKNNNPILVY